MNILEAAAVRRLALVAAVMGGLVSAHLALAVQPQPAQAGIEAIATPATGMRSTSGYGMGTCSEDGTGCAVEYCAAPAASNLDGYAVPCGRNAG